MDKARRIWLIAVSLIMLNSLVQGLGYVVVKIGLEDLPPMWFLTLRCSLAILLFLPIIWSRLRRVNKRLLREGALLGTLLCGFYGCQAMALTSTSAVNAAFICSLYISFTPLVVWLFTKHIRVSSLLLAALSLLGLATFSLTSNLEMASGDLWALLGAGIGTFHLVLLGSFAPRHDVLLLTFVQIVVMAALGLIIAIPAEQTPAILALPAQSWLCLLYGAAFQTVVSCLSQAKAQRTLSPTTTAILMVSQPILGGFFGWALLNEAVTLRKLLGAGILVGCMIATILTDREKKEIAAAGASPQ